MQYYRCKCGENESYGSMSPPACAGCRKCGTTLQTHPDLHREPRPHDYSASIEQRSVQGPITVPVCRYCGRTQWEVEHDKS